MDPLIEEKCRIKEREWREALSEQSKALKELLYAKDSELTIQSEKYNILESDFHFNVSLLTKKTEESKQLHEKCQKQQIFCEEMSNKYNDLLREKKMAEQEMIKIKTESMKNQQSFEKVIKSLTEEVLSIKNAHAETVNDLQKLSQFQIEEIHEKNISFENEVKEQIHYLRSALERSCENAHQLKLQLSQCQEGKDSMEKENLTLKSKIDKNASIFHNEKLNMEHEKNEAKSQLEVYLSENRVFKESLNESNFKIQRLENIVQKISAENLNLKNKITDLTFERESSYKKTEDLSFERQNLIMELEQIKTHPVMLETEKVKDQNNVLREVILEQKQKLLQIKQDVKKKCCDAETQTKSIKAMISTEKRLEDEKRKHCKVATVTKHKYNKKVAASMLSDAELSELDEKRIQNLENVVHNLKHTMIDQLKSQYFLCQTN